MDTEKLAREANRLLADGFNSAFTAWQQITLFRSDERFSLAEERAEQKGEWDRLASPAGSDLLTRMQTYAKMFSFSPEQIALGGIGDYIRRQGEACACKFNDVVAKAIWDSRLDEGRREVEVTLLNGRLRPKVEVCEEHPDGTIVMRGYHDFGVNVIPK